MSASYRVATEWYRIGDAPSTAASAADRRDGDA